MKCLYSIAFKQKISVIFIYGIKFLLVLGWLEIKQNLNEPQVLYDYIQSKMFALYGRAKRQCNESGENVLASQTVL